MESIAFAHQHAPLSIFVLLDIGTVIFIQSTTLQSVIHLQASVSVSPNF